MKQSFILFLALCLFSCSNEPSSFKGNKLNNKEIVFVDTIPLTGDSISFNGNFFMQNGRLVFADTYYRTLFFFDTADGKIVDKRLLMGHGHNEINSFMFAYPVKNSDDIFLLDSSVGLHLLGENGDIRSMGSINFQWDKVEKGNYESMSVYNIMEMSDFGFRISQINDTTLLLPLSLVWRNLDSSKEDCFKKAHNFGLLNTNTMEVEKVFGSYPKACIDNPSNLMDFFSYDMSGDTIYYNHATDPLIYVYKYPNTLLYTFGYDAPDVDRNYTKGYNLDYALMEKEISHVGINTGINFVSETNMLFRTMLPGAQVGDFNYLQAYQGNDLVAETKVPNFFKFLGYSAGKYYGVCMAPQEDADGEEVYFLYAFEIK